jgi:hypothetical protein
VNVGGAVIAAALQMKARTEIAFIAAKEAQAKNKTGSVRYTPVFRIY